MKSGINPHPLLTGLIDYAGLFPPANLPFSEAILEYAAYLNHSDKWMLSRFVIPVDKLIELQSCDSLLRSSDRFAFSFLFRSSDNLAQFLSRFREDLAAISDFKQSFPNVSVGMIELRIPLNAVDSGRPGKLIQMLQQAGEILASESIEPTNLYLELDRSESFDLDLPVVLHAISTINNLNTTSGKLGSTPPFAFKIRTGGVSAGAFPSIEELSRVITLCRDLNVGLKATAGLHHPVRLHHNSVQTKMHGFLNVLAASASAWIDHANSETIQSILQDEDANSFSMSENGLSWKDHYYSPEQITVLRAKGFVSYGSCSFDDPRNDLEALALYTFNNAIGD